MLDHKRLELDGDLEPRPALSLEDLAKSADLKRLERKIQGEIRAAKRELRNAPQTKAGLKLSRERIDRCFQATDAYLRQSLKLKLAEVAPVEISSKPD